MTPRRHLYRTLLRELPPKRTQATPLHRHLRAAFEAGAPPAASDTHAEQLAHYLRHQRMYVTLLERYNPALARDPMTAEENVRLTARRVGMDMPEEFGKA